VTNAETQYAELRAFFSNRGDVSPSGKKGFGSNALTVNGRIFAMLTGGQLVVKLSEARVDALSERGYGKRFDANRGRPMKEWLRVDPTHQEDWLSVAQEAFAFATAGHPVR
jgi:TfoX/Sxy family transcriptional regulator of competence genes